MIDPKDYGKIAKMCATYALEITGGDSDEAALMMATGIMSGFVLAHHQKAQRELLDTWEETLGREESGTIFVDGASLEIRRLDESMKTGMYE